MNKELDPNILAQLGTIIDADTGRVYQIDLKANYSIEKENEFAILIRDLGPWDEFATITNAAESVVADLAGRLAGRRLFYIDSEGGTDELLVDAAGRFAGFKFADPEKMPI